MLTFKSRFTRQFLLCLTYSFYCVGIIFSPSAWAIKYKIYKGYSQEVLVAGEIPLSQLIAGNANSNDNSDSSSETTTTLGEATIAILEHHHIPYLGTSSGINKIHLWPQEDRKLEILGEGRMRAHGWCYDHNGKIPDVMPDQINVTDRDSIVWFLGYAEYSGGQWISYCVPSR